MQLKRLSLSTYCKKLPVKIELVSQIKQLEIMKNFKQLKYIQEKDYLLLYCLSTENFTNLAKVF